MRHLFRRFVNDQSGVTAVEYGLIAGLIAVVIIGAVTSLGTSPEQVPVGRRRFDLKTSAQAKWPSPARFVQSWRAARGGGWTLSRGERHLMMRLLIRFAGEESGLTVVEYALIAGLMALGIIVSVSSVGTTISTKFYGPLSNGFS